MHDAIARRDHVVAADVLHEVVETARQNERVRNPVSGPEPSRRLSNERAKLREPGHAITRSLDTGLPIWPNERPRTAAAAL